MKKIFVLTAVLTCLLSTSETIAQQQPDAKTIRLSARYPDVPLLKRQSANGVVCIKIFEPAGKEANIQTITLTANAAAAKNIDQLLLYQNSSPQFDTAAAGTAIAFKEGKNSIPVSFALKQGWNYIWLGASLKQEADLNSRPSIQVNSITRNRLLHSIAKISGNPAKRIGITVRKPWDDNIHTARIPGLIKTDKGTLIAVYDNRYISSKDLPGNIDVGMSRSTDGGQTWEPMKVIMDMGAPHENNGIGDPTALFDPVTKKIWVAAVWSKGNRAIGTSGPGLSPDSTAQFVLVSSADDGLTWSAPNSITPQIKDPKWQIYFNGPGNGIAMQDGTLVFPSQYWDESKNPGIPHSAIVYSKDNGATWHSGTGARSNTTESQVVETKPGTLMLNMRDNRGFFRAVATTTDLGKTWQEHHTSYHALQDPICMGSLIKANVKVKGVAREVLFFSNVNTSSVQHNRRNMTIKASLDLGETWLPANELLLDERYSFGYSCLTKIDDNTIGILFEGIRDLHFMRIPVTDIIK